MNENGKPGQLPVSVLAQLKAAARRIKRDVMTVYFAAHDPRTPWAARLLALAVAAYALSPIDLVPDFIPVLGYLDDLILLPLGILLVIRLVPPAVLADSRARAASAAARPTSIAAAVAIVLVWLLGIAVLIYLLLR